MQARFYAPWYGRFLSPDPARDQHFEETQSWNIYSYVQNNPTMHIDPTGMYDLKDFGRDMLAGAKDLAIHNPISQAVLQLQDTLLVAPANAFGGQNWGMTSTLGQAAENGASASQMTAHALQGPAEVMAGEVLGVGIGKVVGAVEGRLATRGAEAAVEAGAHAPTDYSGIKSPKDVGASSKPTPRQVTEMKAANRAQNGGVLKSDASGKPMVDSAKSKKGVTPPGNEAQVDHIKPVSAGGTRDQSNLRLITREENRAKGSN